jgi:hypothetical protein
LHDETLNLYSIVGDFLRSPAAHLRQNLANPVRHGRPAKLRADRGNLWRVEHSLYGRQQPQMFSII